MFGPPKDVQGDCNARLCIGDDYGDNVCTMRCKLAAGHEGPHQEHWEDDGSPVTVTWVKDQRQKERQAQVERNCGVFSIGSPVQVVDWLLDDWLLDAAPPDSGTRRPNATGVVFCLRLDEAGQLSLLVRHDSDRSLGWYTANELENVAPGDAATQEGK